MENNNKNIELKYDNGIYFFNFGNYHFLIHDNFIDKRYKKKIVCKYPLCNCNFIVQNDNNIFIDYNQKYDNNLCFINVSLNRNLRQIYECNCFVRFQEKYKNSGYINTMIMVMYKNRYDLDMLLKMYNCNDIFKI